MLCKFFLCSCHKYLSINFFSFGDMNSALRHWANSLHEHNIVLRIWNMCILHVKDWPMEKKEENIVHWQQSEQGHSKCNGLFIESFRRHKLWKNKIQWLNLAFICCSHWLDCHWWWLMVSTMKSLSNILSHV